MVLHNISIMLVDAISRSLGLPVDGGKRNREESKKFWQMRDWPSIRDASHKAARIIDALVKNNGLRSKQEKFVKSYTIHC